MRIGRGVVSSLSLVLVESFALDAVAEPFTRRQVQLAGAVDYGLYAGEAHDVIPSPYGLGLGVRGGYTLAPNIYLGAEANYFFGASRHFPEYGDVEGSLRIFHYGAEAGYDIELLPWVVLRPKLGVGAATVTVEVRVEDNTGEVSESGWVLALGGQLLFGGETLFLGAEARYTSLRIDTDPLQEVPGLAIEERARLDGVLFAAVLGAAF